MRPRVKDILYQFNCGGINQLKAYLCQPNMVIDPSTWANHIYDSINKELNASVEIELHSLIEKFNLYNNGEESK